MLDERQMDQFKENGGAAALKLRDRLASSLQGRITETTQAVNAYFADLKKRKQTIAERIEELKGKLGELDGKVSSYGPRLADATISGNSAALGIIQAELTNLEAQKGAIASQIGLLSGVSVSGDEALFAEADGKAKELDRFWTEIQGDLSELSSFANEQAELWLKVANLSTIGGNIMPRRSVFDRVTEMRRDFEKKEGANHE